MHFKQGGFDGSGNDTPNAGSSLEKYISCATLGEKNSKLGGGNGFALEKLQKCSEIESVAIILKLALLHWKKTFFTARGRIERNTFLKAIQHTLN